MRPSFLRLCQKLSLEAGDWICSSQASIERFKKSSCKADAAKLLSASIVPNHVFAGAGDAQPSIGGKLLQIGGDANSGRGWWWCKLSNPKQEVLTLQAYQFEYSVPSSHTFTVNLPPDAPTGPAQVTVLFPDANNALSQSRPPQFDNIAQYLAWHDEQPASGRSAHDVDAQIREELEGWSD